MASPAFQRILNYARETGVTFSPSGRRPDWEKLGLPSLRGFTPHLRQIQVHDEAEGAKFLDAGNFKALPSRFRWYFHDLMHIMFYDYAAFHLGREAWSDSVRFYEN